MNKQQMLGMKSDTIKIFIYNVRGWAIAACKKKGKKGKHEAAEISSGVDFKHGLSVRSEEGSLI